MAVVCLIFDCHWHSLLLTIQQIQADERYGPSGYNYVSQGVYHPIGAPGADPERQHYHQQAAGQAQTITGQTAVTAEEGQRQLDPPKGPPPAYGTV